MLQKGGRHIDPCNVFVKHLPGDMDDAGLVELFCTHGTVVSAKVMVDPQTNASLGFGFVRFTTAEEASQAIRELDGLKLRKKTLLCKHSNARNQIKSSNLYVKPLLPHTTEEDLRSVFGQYGAIETVKVLTDKKSGVSRQIGFVQFQSQKEADVALRMLDGFQLAPNTPSLTVKYAETQEEKVRRRERMKRRLWHSLEPDPASLFGMGGGPSHMRHVLPPPPMVDYHQQPSPQSSLHSSSSMGPAYHPSGDQRYTANSTFSGSSAAPAPYTYLPNPTASPSGYLSTPSGGPTFGASQYPDPSSMGAPFNPMYGGQAYPFYQSPTPYPFPSYFHMPSQMAPGVGYPSPQMAHASAFSSGLGPSSPYVSPPYASSVSPAFVLDPSNRSPRQMLETGAGEQTMFHTEGSAENATLFVFHWPPELAEHEMRDLFERVGAVEDVKIARHEETRESKGYGFVKMAHPSLAQKAISLLNGYVIENKRLQVSWKHDSSRSRGGPHHYHHHHHHHHQQNGSHNSRRHRMNGHEMVGNDVDGMRGEEASRLQEGREEPSASGDAAAEVLRTGVSGITLGDSLGGDPVGDSNEAL